MRRFAITGAVLAALIPAGVAAATTPPDSTAPSGTSGDTTVETTMVAVAVTDAPDATEAPTDTTAAATDDTTAEAEAPAAEPANIYDDSGNPVATVTVLGSETAASDYEEGNEPEAGNEYVRVTVSVESVITDGTFGINIDNFILQNNNGFVTGAENVPTAAQAESEEEITTEADLANGESVEMVLTFEVVSSVGPQSVFYRSDDEILVDVYEFG